VPEFLIASWAGMFSRVEYRTYEAADAAEVVLYLPAERSLVGVAELGIQTASPGQGKLPLLTRISFSEASDSNASYIRACSPGPARTGQHTEDQAEDHPKAES